jgi:DNA-binding transcriptional ArsR family regulator
LRIGTRDPAYLRSRRWGSRSARQRPLDRQVTTCLLSAGVSDEVFKALADPTRRVILDELAERDGQTLFEICARLAMKHGLGSSRQAISQHLDALESAGLVRTRKDGRYKFHDIDRRPLEGITERWKKRGARR